MPRAIRSLLFRLAAATLAVAVLVIGLLGALAPAVTAGLAALVALGLMGWLQEGALNAGRRSEAER